MKTGSRAKFINRYDRQTLAVLPKRGIVVSSKNFRKCKLLRACILFLYKLKTVKIYSTFLFYVLCTDVFRSSWKFNQRERFFCKKCMPGMLLQDEDKMMNLDGDNLEVANRFSNLGDVLSAKGGAQ